MSEQRRHREPEHVSESNTDHTAWLAAAKARKYRIHDGKVWSGGSGLLFSLDPLPGFSSLPNAVQPLVFQSVAQFVTNRVGQVAEGNVQKAVKDALDGASIPSANTNDAFERHFMNTVEARVRRMAADGAFGETIKALFAKTSKEAKPEQDKIVIATATKTRGGTEDGENERFAEFRDAGIAAALNKPVTEKKRQPKKEVDTSMAVPI